MVPSPNTRLGPTDESISIFVAEVLQSRGSGFAAVATGLEQLRISLGLEHLAIGIDDLGASRQVFAAARRPLGTLEGLCVGPARAAAVPSLHFTAAQQRLLNAAVTQVVAKSFDAERPRSVSDFGVLAKPVRFTRRSDLPVAVVVVSTSDLLANGLERALQHLSSRLRTGESIEQAGPTEFIWMLIGSSSQEVPVALARIVREGVLGPLVYGIAVAPNVECDPQTLIGSARQRMEEARLLAIV